MTRYQTEALDLRLQDNMELMREFPDKHFELAIVDPPYGLGKRTTDGGGTNSQIKFMQDIRRSNWDDDIPNPDYFAELKRISQNQIIWGGNYFPLPPTRTVICWEKMVEIPTMSQIEMAWTSFDSPARIIKINNTDRNRFHPTQKPIALYRWLLANYAKQGDKILDTHLGSMSHAIAAHYSGVHLTGCELDPDYFTAGIERVKRETAQMDMFADAPKSQQIETMKLL
jgi:site-specific DNA-methyltransferase (adenine-specific)